MGAPPLLNAALDYASKGLPVFPCDPDTKRPFPGSHGFKDATTDEQVIRSWWSDHPGAMIGIPTGKPSGVWVLDVDDPASFEAACPVQLPQTQRCETGKGYHLYFQYDPASPVTNAQRHRTRGWPFAELPGAETRGDGGYVIVPPSRHPSGRFYRWASNDDPVAAPRDLLRLVTERKRVEDQRPHLVQPVGSDTPYGLKALDDECAAIMAAGNGEQEGTLNEAALKIGALVAGGELSLSTATARLLSAGMAMPSYNQRDKWTVTGIAAKIERGLSDGAASPRKAPERPLRVPDERFDPVTGEVFADEGGAPEPSPGVIDPGAFPEPVDLWMRYEEPNLPKGLLPEVIERFSFRQGEIMGADPAGLAMAALTVCAAAIPDSVALQVKRNDPTWRENARLWTALVGPPSRKKTPIFKAALAPLRSLDNALMRTFMQSLSAHEALPAAERKAAERPKQKRLIISDATVEAAQEVLRDSPDGVLSEQDELSGWFGAMDKYAPGKGAQADRAFWLKAFNGGTYNLNRIGRGSSQIPNLSICLLGGIQPEPIRKLAADSVDDGLVQRLLPVILKPSAIGRDLPPDEAARDYGALVASLNQLRPPMTGSYSGECQSAPLHFSSGAKAIRDRLEQEHLDLVTALEFVSPKLASHFGKYDGIFARLCLLWHCIESAGDVVPPDEVSERTAARVAQFMEQFLRPSAIAFYAGMLGMSAGHEDLLALASWIVAKGLDEVKARDAQRSTQSFRAMTADQFRLLCEKLEAFGWLEKGEPGPNSNTPRWVVNPRVHEHFSDRAKREQKRRAAAREALGKALGGQLSSVVDCAHEHKLHSSSFSDGRHEITSRTQATSDDKSNGSAAHV